MFGDWEWNGSRTKAQEVEYESFQVDLVKGIKLVVIEIGLPKYFNFVFFCPITDY